jgi:hypothetical protein
MTLWRAPPGYAIALSQSSRVASKAGKQPTSSQRKSSCVKRLLLLRPVSSCATIPSCTGQCNTFKTKNQTQITNMKKSQIFWTGYLIIGVVTAIYGSIWGEMHYRSFAYNLGRGLIWPVILFPVLGKIIGAFIIVAFVLTLLAFKKS